MGTGDCPRRHTSRLENSLSIYLSIQAPLCSGQITWLGKNWMSDRRSFCGADARTPVPQVRGAVGVAGGYRDGEKEGRPQ